MSTSGVDRPWFPMARDPAISAAYWGLRQAGFWGGRLKMRLVWNLQDWHNYILYYIKMFIVLCYIYMCVCVHICMHYNTYIYIYSHAGISANESKQHKWVHPRFIFRLLVLPLKPCVILQHYHDSPWRCQGWHHLWSMSGAAARLVDVVIGSDSKPFQ